jgi:hypothetical protein
VILPDASVADAAVADAAVVDASMVDAAIPDAFVPDAATVTSFEDCCAQQGCTDSAGVAACSVHAPAYGRCSIAGVAGVCASTSLCNGDWTHTAGYCPGPADIQCCTPAQPAVDGGRCLGTEHPLPNVGLSPEPLEPRCPDGMKLVNAQVCVDVYEAFISELSTDGGLLDWSPYFNPGTRRMLAQSAPGAVPQGYINADQAESACQNAGKRLCTSAEWQRACRGSSMTTYPYGNTRQPGVCNDARSVHPAIEYFGASDPNPFSKIDHPCLNQLANGLDRTGANPGCITEDGLGDMMGNLHEWVADVDGTFRGGFYVDTVINGNGCLYVTTAHNRLHWDYSTGFRCCADPLP